MREGLKKLGKVIIGLCLVLVIIMGGIKLRSSGLVKNSNVVKNYNDYYNAVMDGLYNHDDTVVVNVFDFDKDIYNLDVVEDVVKENGELMENLKNYNLKSKKLTSVTEITLSFNYCDSKEAIKNKENEVESKIQNIIDEVIETDMKDYEKERVLHDYVINNCKFDQRYFSGDMPKESYTAYGVLVNGEAVCQGYAMAMNKLLNAAGIESRIVVGEVLSNESNDYIGHAWNIVKIGGENYHLDATWDDPVMDDGSDKLMYSYFNITDNQIKLNHKWNENDYPKCTNTEYSFENLNLVEKDSNGNDIVIVEDYDEFSSNIRDDLSNMHTGKTYKIIDFDMDKDSVEKYINGAYESLSKEGTYIYSMEFDEITRCGYVTVSFE